MTRDAIAAAEELRTLNDLAKLQIKGFIHLPEQDASRAVELFEQRSKLLRDRIAAGSH